MKLITAFSIGVILLLYTAVSPQAGMSTPKTAGLRDSSQYYVQKIINAKKPVLIDFWAVWCGPCKILTPIIAELKKEYEGEIEVLKVNIDRNRSLATYFRVVSIPHVFIVKDKIVVDNVMGVQPKEVYSNAIKSVIKPENPSQDSIK